MPSRESYLATAVFLSLDKKVTYRAVIVIRNGPLVEPIGELSDETKHVLNFVAQIDGRNISIFDTL